MAVFKDAADVDAHLAQIFREAVGDPELGPKFAESGVVLKLHYTEPTCTLTADFPNSTIYFDDVQAPAPNVEMFMKADVAHRFWLGKVNIAAALAKGEMRAKGPIPKILKMVPLAKTVFPRYAELCERMPVGAA
jgi:putative sterol carrier protein